MSSIPKPLAIANMQQGNPVIVRQSIDNAEKAVRDAVKGRAPKCPESFAGYARDFGDPFKLSEACKDVFDYGYLALNSFYFRFLLAGIQAAIGLLWGKPEMYQLVTVMFKVAVQTFRPLCAEPKIVPSKAYSIGWGYPGIGAQGPCMLAMVGYMLEETFICFKLDIIRYFNDQRLRNPSNTAANVCQVLDTIAKSASALVSYKLDSNIVYSQDYASVMMQEKAAGKHIGNAAADQQNIKKLKDKK